MSSSRLALLTSARLFMRSHYVTYLYQLVHVSHQHYLFRVVLSSVICLCACLHERETCAGTTWVYYFNYTIWVYMYMFSILDLVRFAMYRIITL